MIVLPQRTRYKILLGVSSVTFVNPYNYRGSKLNGMRNVYFNIAEQH